MKKTQFILAVTLLLGGASFAGTYSKMVVTPEPVCGPFYFSAFGGGSFLDDGEFTQTNAPAGAVATQGRLGLDNGWIAGIAAGVRTANAWRFEVELSHQQGDVENYIQTNPFAAALGMPGDVERTSVMLNVVKEFQGLNIFGLTPYLGAGLGLTNVEFVEWQISGMSIDDTVFGYQAMAGLTFDLTQCLQAYLEYRVTSHSDLEDTRTFVAGPNPLGDLDLGWTQHVILGLRLYF